MNNLEEKILKRRLRFYKIYTQAKIYGFENPEGFALLEALIEIRKEQEFGNLYQLERYRNFFKKMVRYKGR